MHATRQTEEVGGAENADLVERRGVVAARGWYRGHAWWMSALIWSWDEDGGRGEQLRARVSTRSDCTLLMFSQIIAAVLGAIVALTSGLASVWNGLFVLENKVLFGTALFSFAFVYVVFIYFPLAQLVNTVGALSNIKKSSRGKLRSRGQ